MQSEYPGSKFTEVELHAESCLVTGSERCVHFLPTCWLEESRRRRFQTCVYVTGVNLTSGSNLCFYLDNNFHRRHRLKPKQRHVLALPDDIMHDNVSSSVTVQFQISTCPPIVPMVCLNKKDSALPLNRNLATESVCVCVCVCVSPLHSNKLLLFYLSLLFTWVAQDLFSRRGHKSFCDTG